MCDALHCSIVRVELGKNHVRTHTGHTFVWYILKTRHGVTCATS